MRLIKTDNVITLSGEEEIFVHRSKSVNVDGQVYTKNWYDIVKYQDTELYDKYPHYQEDMGIPGLFELKVKTIILDDIYMPHYYSQNKFINIYYNINHYSLQPSWIGQFYMGKEDRRFKPISDNFKIDLQFHSYGWNNFVSVMIPLYRYLKMETQNRNQFINTEYINKQLKSMFGIDNQKDIQTNQLLKVLNTQINIKQNATSKQQIATPFHL